MPFDVARYQSLRRSLTVGVEVVHFEDTGSTMDEARAGSDAGRPPGTVYVAAAQSAGRGRLGRSWVSEPGAGLWVTYHLVAGRNAPLLSIAGGLAMVDALQTAVGLQADLKWPNDVQHQGRKLCGVLAESRPRGDGSVEVFLGIGLNLRTPDGLPPEVLATATSVEQEGRPAPAWEVMLAALSSALEPWVTLVERDPERLLDAWRARLVTLGKQVRLSLPDGTSVEGLAVDVAPGGELVIDVEGQRRFFAAGDVTSTRLA